jgi:hypothetical protein
MILDNKIMDLKNKKYGSINSKMYLNNLGLYDYKNNILYG